MTDLILYILLKIPCMRARYPKGLSDMLAMEDASYHVNFYLKWGWILPPMWIVQILYRECITDGHVDRIRKNTESPASLLDFKVDLLTRFAGLAIPFLSWTIIGVLCYIL